MSSDDLLREKKALLAIKKLKSEIKMMKQQQSEPIAVIGLSARFPKAKNKNEFWNLLRDGVDAITEIPESRFDINEFYDPDPQKNGKIYTRMGGFIEDIERFDPEFFGISPREAISLDPQQRILLEEVYHAFEDAGLSIKDAYGSKTGVFIGMMGNDFLHQSLFRDPSYIDAYTSVGTLHSASVGRISFIYGFEGPAVAIDTACSSALTAIHQGIQSLRMRESDQVISGGINLILSPGPYITECKANMLSKDGRCKTFDESAGGYVRGEGCGIVLLKRLSDAVKDNDNIYALIRGSAMNQDGRSSGLTVPNGPMQERVIQDALTSAGVDPLDVSYLEAHGSGTPLGDPIEVRAAAKVYGKNRDEGKPLFIGSVKTNIGHLESAAGIAGFIKLVLSLKNHQIPQNLHFKQPNTHIDWDKIPVKVVKQTQNWEALSDKRLAGLSSFGFSGTNVHMILEEYALANQEDEIKTDVNEWKICPLSAKSSKDLLNLSKNYSKDCETLSKNSLSHFCYTLAAGRAHYNKRAYALVKSMSDVQKELTDMNESHVSDCSDQLKTVFLFTGQGSQYFGMAKELYEKESVFKDAVDVCASVFREEYADSTSNDLLKITGIVQNSDNDQQLINETQFTQPAIYALEVSLFKLMKHFGVIPDAVLGHSVGEYAAAVAAGLFDMETGMRLIMKRSKLMSELPSGEGVMLAVIKDEDAVEELIGQNKNLNIAAENGANTVVSGPKEDILNFKAICDQKGIHSVALKTSHAFHSHMMDPILKSFEAFCEQFSFGTPEIDFISNVSGEVLNPEDSVSPAYWSDHIRKPVLFKKGMQNFKGEKNVLFLEIGPHPILSGMGQKCINCIDTNSKKIFVNTLKRGASDQKGVVRACGEYYIRGGKLDFHNMFIKKDQVPQKISVSGYPFSGEQYTLEGKDSLKKYLEGQKEINKNLSCLYEFNWQETEKIKISLVNPSKNNGWLILTNSREKMNSLNQSFQKLGYQSTILDLYDTDQIEKTITLKKQFEGVVIHHHNEFIEQKIINLNSIEHDSKGYKQIFLTIKNLIKHKAQIEKKLTIITQNSHSVDKELPYGIGQATLWGLKRVVNSESPELKPMIIDLEEQHLGSNDGDDLRDEILHSKLNEVVLRAGKRFESTMKTCSMSQNEVDQVTLDKESLYLITGGTGGIGAVISKKIHEMGGVNQVLLSRRGLIQGSQSEKEIKALNEQGANIKVLKIDISKEDDVKHLFDELSKMGMPLKGIVHAAGVSNLSLIKDETFDQIEKIFAAKIKGTWFLHEELLRRNIKLDFFSLFSSISSTPGLVSFGLSGYASANAFCDAYSWYANRINLNATAINWGVWEEVGMGLEEGVIEKTKLLGGKTISNQEGCDIFQASLSKNLEQLVLLSETPQKKEMGESKTSLFDELKAVSKEEREDYLKEVLQKEVKSVLKLSNDPSLSMGYLEMGMDSILSIEIGQKLQNKFGDRFTFSSTFVFDYPTIEQTAAYILRELQFSDDQNEQIEQSEQELSLSTSDEISAIQNMNDRELLEELHSLTEEVLGKGS